MLDKNNKFRDQLIGMDSINQDLKTKYEKEVKTMLEKKLNLTQKISFTISGILGLVIAGFFAYTSIYSFTLDGHETHEVVVMLRIIRGTFIFGSIMAFLWSGMMFWILKRGTLNLRRDNKITAGWTWGITLTTMVVMLVIGGSESKRTGMSCSILVRS